MRDFFAQQERARRNTGWLVLLFFFAVVAIAAAVYLAMVIGLRHFDLHKPPPGQAAGWWDPELFLSFFVGTLVIILFASLLRGLSLRSGGSAVAEMLGGRLVPPGTTDFHERRLLNVVEEMALAASMPVPQVYLLEEEPGINAFAAGHTPDDAAVIATRGCIELLGREELQGIMAHEFSHILNGDMRLKLRLMGIIFGILVISVIGRGMLRVTRFSAGSSRRGKGGGAVMVVVVAGLALMIIGYIGLFCGRLIKAAVSRQREFLADAAAVQFTRNPHGIGNALKKIGGYVHGSQVQASAAEETSHFFFSRAVDYPVFGFWFATHPPLGERIRRIDPSFDGTYPQIAVAAAAGAEHAAAIAPAAAGAAPVRPRDRAAEPRAMRLEPGAVLQQVGSPDAEHARQAAQLLRRLPGTVQQAVRDPFSAGALIYALLLAEDAPTQKRQSAEIERGVGAALVRETWRVSAALVGLDPRWRLSLLKLALPALRQMTGDQSRAFAATVDALIAADDKVTVFEYALSRTLLRSLAASRGHREGGRRVRSLAAVRESCGVVLSVLARNGVTEESAARRAFAAGAGRLGEVGGRLALVAPAGASLEVLDHALSDLRRTVPRLREQILEACVYCALADRRVSVTEAELLRVMADALECPLPPFSASHPLPRVT